MRRVLVLTTVIALLVSSIVPASASRAYVISYAGDRSNWGNLCSTAPGIGWFCVAEVQVTNRTGKMINPRLTAELIDTRGRKFTPSNNPQNEILIGVFQNSFLNPGETLGWAINFTTGPNVKFKQLNIYEGRKKVASFKYSCASRVSDAFC